MYDIHYNSREEEKKNSIFAPNYTNLKRAAYKASRVLFSLGWTNPSSVMMYHYVAPSALVRVPFPSTDCNMMVPPSPPMWTTMMPCHTSLPKPHCLLTLGTVPELSSWPRSHFNVKHIESTLDLDFKTPAFSFKWLDGGFHHDATQNMFPIPIVVQHSLLGHWNMFFFVQSQLDLRGRAASGPACLQHGTN